MAEWVPGTVRFENGERIEWVVEHNQQNGGDSNQKLLSNTLLLWYFDVADKI